MDSSVNVTAIAVASAVAWICIPALAYFGYRRLCGEPELKKVEVTDEDYFVFVQEGLGSTPAVGTSIVKVAENEYMVPVIGKVSKKFPNGVEWLQVSEDAVRLYKISGRSAKS